MREEAFGTYPAPVLTIETGSGRLMLESIGRDLLRDRGRVDRYAWPTLFRVMLLNDDTESGWKIRTDSGIMLHQPWDKDTFVTLAQDLMAAG